MGIEKLNDRLKRCPFCGNLAVVEALDIYADHDHWVVKCTGCRATLEHDCHKGPGVVFSKSGLEMWNERVADPPITCKECKKYHTTDCALWVSTTNGTAYFREHGGNFSCAWAERGEVVKWLRPEPCPVTPEQFNAIYNDNEEDNQ